MGIYCSNKILHYVYFVRYVLAVVAAAPYDKKVFSDEFIDELKKEILEKVMPKDAHNVPGTLCLLVFLNISHEYDYIHFSEKNYQLCIISIIFLLRSLIITHSFIITRPHRDFFAFRLLICHH